MSIRELMEQSLRTEVAAIETDVEMVKLSVSEIKSACKNDDRLIEIYVNGQNGHVRKDGNTMFSIDATERLLLTNMYLMVRELYEDRHKETCQSNQAACDRND